MPQDQTATYDVHDVLVVQVPYLRPRLKSVVVQHLETASEVDIWEDLDIGVALFG